MKKMLYLVFFGTACCLTAFAQTPIPLTSENFNTYVPSLTGSGASGNWNINAINAVNWNYYSFAGHEENLGYLMGYNTAIDKYTFYNATNIKSFLGMPVGGETLQSVTDRGNTTNSLRILADNALQFGGTGASNFGQLYFNSTNKALQFTTSIGANTLVIKDDNENVGIGTTAPVYKLDVNGDGRFSGALSLNNSTEGYAVPVLKINSGTGGALNSGGAIEFYKGMESSPMGRIFTTNTFSSGIGNSVGKLMFSSYNNKYNDELTLAGGNVGIGTTSPIPHADGTALVVSGTGQGTRGMIEVWGDIAGKSIFQSVAGNTVFGNLKRGAGSGDVYLCYGDGATGIFVKGVNGNIGIGTTEPQSELAVKGTITSMKVKVTQAGWADYVFDSSYQLAPLHEVEKFVQTNKHLPEVPSAAEVKTKGLDIGDNQALLLKKIEELTLYIIEQNKKVDDLKDKVEVLKEKVKVLEEKK